MIKTPTNIKPIWQREWALIPVWMMVVLIELFGEIVWSEPIRYLLMVAVFLVLFLTILGAAFRTVHHAENLAARLGEPFGSLILTLAVVTIEVSIIAAIMLGGEQQQPTMARDTMYAVIMITIVTSHRIFTLSTRPI